MSDQTRPARGRPRTFNHQHVIDTAMETYWREGIEGVSLNEVCRLASVPKPSVYREFGGEDGLIDAALEHYAISVLEPAASEIDPTAPFRDVLNALVELCTNPTQGRPPGCLLARMQHTPDQLESGVAARVEELRNQARQRYASLVDLAKERGEVPPHIPTSVAAAMIDITCNTLLMRMTMGEEPALLRAQAMLAFDALTTDQNLECPAED